VVSRTKTQTRKVKTMRHYYTNDAGQIFVVFNSSRKGLLNVSLNTGSREFLGYVRTLEDANILIRAKFGDGVRKVA